jgi:transposase
VLTLPPTVRIFIATAPVDMRRSFDSLAGMAEEAVGTNPATGHLFVFFARHRIRIT